MKKIIAIMMAAALSLSMVGCGGSSSGSKDAEGDAGANASQTEDTKDGDDKEAASDEDSSSEGGTLIMATNAAFPPYEYYDGDKIVGIDAEIAEAIAKELGKELQIDDMDFSSIITAIQTGKADFGAAGMTVTPEREENVNFTDVYATGVQVIIVPEDSDIASPDDLEGKMIGVQESTTGHIYCSDDYGEDHVQAYPTGANAVEALKTGKVDCVVIDNEPAKAFVEANEGLKILDTEYVTEEYAIAVAKDNEQLLNDMNEAMAKLKEDGTIQSIIDKYIPAN